MKESADIRGSSQRILPILRLFSIVLGKTLSRPGGKPASTPSFAKYNETRGVSSDGAFITEHPAAMAAPAFLVTMATGTFHGVIAATGPTGCLTCIGLQCVMAGVSTSPVNPHFICAAKCSRNSVAKSISPMLSASSFPSP